MQKSLVECRGDGRTGRECPKYFVTRQCTMWRSRECVQDSGNTNTNVSAEKCALRKAQEKKV